MSRTATGGTPAVYCTQFFPASRVIHNPISVPANKRLGSTRSCLILCAYPFISAVEIFVQLLPAFVVINIQVRIFPVACPSNVTNAVFLSYVLASTLLTQVQAGRPGTFFTTLLHVFPPSIVSCKFPSSVPTHIMFSSFGDSQMVKMVQ